MVIQVNLDFIPIVMRPSQNVEEGRLSIHKHVLLKSPITSYGIVIGLLHAPISFLIVCAVSYHVLTVVGMHFQEL